MGKEPVMMWTVLFTALVVATLIVLTTVRAEQVERVTAALLVVFGLSCVLVSVVILERLI